MRQSLLKMSPPTGDSRPTWRSRFVPAFGQCNRRRSCPRAERSSESSHFRRQHRPDASQVRALKETGQIAADRIIALRAHRVGAEYEQLRSIKACRNAILVADKLLNGRRTGKA